MTDEEGRAFMFAIREETEKLKRLPRGDKRLWTPAAPLGQKEREYLEWLEKERREAEEF